MPPIVTENYADHDGNPAGGYAQGVGFHIQWQDGPLVDPITGERRGLSGAFIEDVLEAVLDRLNFYQGEDGYEEVRNRLGEFVGAGGRFRCRENSLAKTHIQEALHWLRHRTADRERRGVEGTHQK